MESLLIRVADEYNGGGHLIYADNFTGAYVRGRTCEEATVSCKIRFFDGSYGEQWMLRKVLQSVYLA